MIRWIIYKKPYMIKMHMAQTTITRRMNNPMVPKSIRYGVCSLYFFLLFFANPADATFVERGADASTTAATSSIGWIESLTPEQLFRQIRGAISVDISGFDITITPPDIRAKILETTTRANDKIRDAIGVDIFKFADFIVDMIKRAFSLIMASFK